MRLVAVSKVLDEADVIEAFARHTAAYVSHHIILDNGSCDGTVDILKQLRNEGLQLTLLHNDSRQFYEEKFNTILYHLALTVAAADWVIFLDADEFIDDREATSVGSGLKPILDRQDTAVSCVRVLLTNYQATVWDNQSEPIIPVRLGWRQGRSEVEKVIVRGNLANRGVTVLSGSHGVLIDGGQTCPYQKETVVTLAHYSERSPFQAAVKFIRGWSKVLAAGESEIRKGTAFHYRERFETLRDRPRDLLRSSWLHQFHCPTEGLTHDPIGYLGGALRFTPVLDEQMRAVRCLMRTLETLSTQYGRLLEECPGARDMVNRWSEDISLL
jgi:Glycosyl transferase family 2